MDHWQPLRLRRSTQRIPDNSEDRRQTFQSALDQAEQQFRAAQVTGPQSRALNLFYGLSQAGRAIAAAAPALQADDYLLRAHGIHPGRADAYSGTVAGFPLRSDTNPHGSFVRLSNLLGSALPKSFTISDAWRSILELRPHPINSDLVGTLEVEIRRGDHPSSEGGIERTFHFITAHIPAPVLRTLDTEQLVDYLNRYPALRGWFRGFPWWPEADRPSDISPSLAYVLPNGFAGDHLFDDRVHWSSGHAFVAPAIGRGDGDDVFHPLMAWWAVLFGLSVLTRYHPALWTRYVNVDVSRDATALEAVLRRAITTVPILIEEAIASVASP